MQQCTKTLLQHIDLPHSPVILRHILAYEHIHLYFLERIKYLNDCLSRFPELRRYKANTDAENQFCHFPPSMLVI